MCAHGIMVFRVDVDATAPALERHAITTPGILFLVSLSRAPSPSPSPSPSRSMFNHCPALLLPLRSTLAV